MTTAAAATTRVRRPAVVGLRARSDRGSASVLALGVIAVVFVLTAATVALLAATLASHRARAAADLGALAGAEVLNEGPAWGSPCQVAAEVVSRNRSALVGCRISGSSIEIQVESTAPMRGIGPATARARAGPDPAHVDGWAAATAAGAPEVAVAATTGPVTAQRAAGSPAPLAEPIRPPGAVGESSTGAGPATAPAPNRSRTRTAPALSSG